MVHYRLTYFGMRGRAEAIRQLFEIAGVKYDDVRIDQAAWAELKKTTPFGHLPVLEVDGHPLGQSHAIMRFLARQFGLAGKTPLEEALVDSIADQFADFTAEIRPFFVVAAGFAPGDKEQLFKDVVLPAREKFFPILEKFLAKGNGYLVGGALTYADVYIAENFATGQKLISDFYGNHTAIADWVNKVQSHPKIASWIERRPKTAV